MKPILLIAACLLASVACTDDEAATPQTHAVGEASADVVAYLQTNFGTQVTRQADLTAFVVDAEGDAVTSGELSVEVEGFGTRSLYVEEIVSAASKGGSVLLYLEDLESGENRFFDYDAAENYVAFGQDLLDPSEEGFEERGAAVSRRDDGKYVVFTFDDQAGREDEQVVDDGFAALGLVEQYSEFGDISPHIMMAAVALGHTPVPEARFGNSGENSTAPRPPVCAIFKEFCDCAACAVLDRGGDCDLCPAL